MLKPSNGLLRLGDGEQHVVAEGGGGHDEPAGDVVVGDDRVERATRSAASKNWLSGVLGRSAAPVALS